MELIFRTKDKVDYEKIKEITREVVKDELNERNQPEMLSRADIKEAVSAGITQAYEERENKKKEDLEKVKIPATYILLMVICGIVGVLFLAIMMYEWVEAESDLWKKIGAIYRPLLIVLLCIIMEPMIFMIGKKKDDTNAAINVISVMLAFASFVYAALSSGVPK